MLVRRILSARGKRRTHPREGRASHWRSFERLELRVVLTETAPLIDYPSEPTLHELVPGGFIQYEPVEGDTQGSTPSGPPSSPSLEVTHADILLFPSVNLAANTAALDAFNRAADFWEARFADPIAIRIDADLSNQGFQPNVLGETSPVTGLFMYHDVRERIFRDASDDEPITGELPNSTDQLTFNRHALVNTLSFTGAPGSPILQLSRAGAAALGLRGVAGRASQYAGGNVVDATIRFNSAFTFDFDRGDGIAAGAIDFEGVAIHEIGHVLGFSSTVDSVDRFVAEGNPVNLAPSALDLFRLAPAQGTNSFSTAARILNTGANVVNQVTFDGGHFDPAGLAGFNAGDIPMATGVTFGDGNQASHFRDGLGIGIMDPTLGNGEFGTVTANDLRVLGLVGWDWIDGGGFGATPTFGINLRTTSDTTPTLSGTVSEPSAEVFVRIPEVSAGTNQATLLIDGDSNIVDAFTLTNAATSIAQIDRIDIAFAGPGVVTVVNPANDQSVLSPNTPFFNTTGANSNDFRAVAADATAVGLVSPQSDATNDADVFNLGRTLTITFDDFDPGESFRWRIDMDQRSFAGSDVVTGDMLTGAAVTVWFENGLRLPCTCR